MVAFYFSIAIFGWVCYNKAVYKTKDDFYEGTFVYQE